MSVIDKKPTRTDAIDLIEEAVTESLLSEVECAWKDHWYSIVDNANSELIAAIETLTGKSIEDVKSFDLNFNINVESTFIDR